MKFQTSDNLIDLLVGQNLYSTPDVAMRELLQNAEDACDLQAAQDRAFEPEIIVRFSSTNQWVEICDNGLGMDQEIFEDSFATIGASKAASPKLQALIARAGNRPIGQFGIGVLSCFGVADIIEVRTHMDGEQPVSVRITDRHQEFEQLSDHRNVRGTTLRLVLKHGGPMRAENVPDAVSRYVRHARHIWLENADASERAVARDQWLLPTWEDGSSISAQALESGHLQLSDAWDNLNVGLNSEVVLCSAGFLVNQSAQVLPEYALGVRGEINVRAGALTILMNREGFQQDDRWSAFVSELTSHYRRRVREKLSHWLQVALADASYDKLRAMQRMVLLILRSPLGQVAGEENVELARQLIPNVLLLAGGDTVNFDALLTKARAKPPLYVHRTDEQQQVQRSFSDRGQNLSLTETVRSLDLRLSLLRINGFAVARVERHDYAVQVGPANRSIQIHDFDALSEACGRMGIEVKRVQDAPTEHTRIGSSPDAEAITRLFEMSSDLKIQSVENMTDAIIADFGGYILNARNPEIRAILAVMPDAVGNPVRKELLSAYLALSTWDVSKARATILRLITDPEFQSKARRTTGQFFRAYLEKRVAALLASSGDING
jgi:hypothetical protein